MFDTSILKRFFSACTEERERDGRRARHDRTTSLLVSIRVTGANAHNAIVSFLCVLRLSDGHKSQWRRHTCITPFFVLHPRGHSPLMGFELRETFFQMPLYYPHCNVVFCRVNPETTTEESMNRILLSWTSAIVEDVMQMTLRERATLKLWILIRHFFVLLFVQN